MLSPCACSCLSATTGEKNKWAPLEIESSSHRGTDNASWHESGNGGGAAGGGGSAKWSGRHWNSTGRRRGGRGRPRHGYYQGGQRNQGAPAEGSYDPDHYGVVGENGEDGAGPMLEGYNGGGCCSC